MVNNVLSNFALPLYKRSGKKCRNCILKTCFQRGFDFVKKIVTYTEKSVTATKQKQLQKFKNQYKLYFGTLVLASHYYCGDNG